MSDWVWLYLYARYIRIDRDAYSDRIYVYQGGDCLLNKEKSTGKINILVKEIDYNDLKAIMEVL